MSEDWNEDMNKAPRDEHVLVCPTDCHIVVGIQLQIEKQWVWTMAYTPPGQFYDYIPVKAKAWRPLPFPPKHLYERKLIADALEKQVADLRKE